MRFPQVVGWVRGARSELGRRAELGARGVDCGAQDCSLIALNHMYTMRLYPPLFIVAPRDVAFCSRGERLGWIPKDLLEPARR